MVQISVANDRDGETESSRPCDTGTQTRRGIRASSVVCPEDLSLWETIELESRGEAPWTQPRLDCRFGLASCAAIVVDEAKAFVTRAS